MLICALPVRPHTAGRRAPPALFYFYIHHTPASNFGPSLRPRNAWPRMACALPPARMFLQPNPPGATNSFPACTRAAAPAPSLRPRFCFSKGHTLRFPRFSVPPVWFHHRASACAKRGRGAISTTKHALWPFCTALFCNECPCTSEQAAEACCLVPSVPAVAIPSNPAAADQLALEFGPPTAAALLHAHRYLPHSPYPSATLFLHCPLQISAAT